MTLVLPHPNAFEEDALIEAPPLKETFLAIAAKFSEGIDNSDISPTAGVEGTKLYVGTDNQKKIQTAAIADGAVTGGTGAGAKIAADTITRDNIATDGVGANELRKDAAVDGNRSVTTDHIRDRAVTGAKLATGGIVKFGQLLTTRSVVAFTAYVIPANTSVVLDLSLAVPAAGVAVTTTTPRGNTHQHLSHRWRGSGNPLADIDYQKVIASMYIDTATPFKFWLILANASASSRTVSATLEIDYSNVT